MPPVVSPVLGQVLKGLFAGIMLLRRPRPIHADGVMLEGRMTWLGNTRRAGIRWIDSAPDAPVPVVARASRSIGLPAPLPDIVGLALRVPAEHGAVADLEFASTGFGVPSRFWLTLHRSPSRARLGTLFPHRSSYGAVLLAARTLAPDDLPVPIQALARDLEHRTWRLELYWARPGGKWNPFARLELTRPAGPLDSELRFDAVDHPLPGAGVYDWVRAVRQPAYRLARRSPATPPTLPD